ncbi:aldose epimerase family protein [Planktotalea sp.]|uniref:aldose epimerase family protein n=1 Tax=Planktotalea sp. TaxID=2029877 RepID=UPI0025DD21BA|nr:aldose epimerase family protein [Planktotalea sp.]
MSLFGQMPDGRAVHAVDLKTDRLSVKVLTYGASLQSVRIDGAQTLLGSDDLADYWGPLNYAGAIVGRVANRLGNGSAIINGLPAKLTANEPSGASLHGGPDGASEQLWTLVESGSTHVMLSLHMPDGHMGYPGALDVHARYEVDGTTLRLEISAQADKETLCSFASHGYWNLSGEANIDAHKMKITATRYLPVDGDQIPTGEVADVQGTTFDFTATRPVAGAVMDHNFCLSLEREKLRPVFWLSSGQSGVALEIATTETGLQVYDARHMDRAALAVEPQIWPDAVNHDEFPSMVLKLGETYSTVTEFRFSKSTHS